MIKIMHLCLCIVFLLSTMAYATKTVDVHVAVGKVSEVVFPHKVAKVIKGGANDSVLIEVIEQSVYVLPKVESPANIFVTDVTGESYPLNLMMAPQHDIRVEVSGDGRRQTAGLNKVNALDIMKEILLGHEPQGASKIQGGQKILLSDGQIQLNVEVIYDFPNVQAYILRAENQTSNAVIIPVEQISFPNLLAVSVESDMLNRQGSQGDVGKVYLITGK